MLYIYVIYIYIYIKSPPWINKRPPLPLFSPQNDLFHCSFTIKKARHILNSGQDFINMFLRHGRYQQGHLRGHLGDHPFSLKARPPKK